jgi:hypothetical protein
VPLPTLGRVDEILPAPVPGAPLTSGSLARLSVGVAARDVADFARSLVPTGPPPRGGYGGALLADALRLQVLAERVLAAAVVAERLDGTEWDELATELGVGAAETRERWQPAVVAWEHGVEHVAAFGNAPDTSRAVAEPAAVAAALDRWVAFHRESGDPVAGEQAVTSGLRQMDPMRELLHLAAVRRVRDAAQCSTADVTAREAALEQAIAHAPA